MGAPVDDRHEVLKDGILKLDLPFGVHFMDDVWGAYTPSLRVQTAPELEDAGNILKLECHQRKNDSSSENIDILNDIGTRVTM